MSGICPHEQGIVRLTTGQGAGLRAMHMQTRRAVQPLRVGVQKRIQQLQQNQNPTQQGYAFSFGHY